jgi:pimeloyl-ACP methyl ester carboxylesterase
MSEQKIKAQTTKPASPPPGFHHKYAKVNGITIHYVIGGKGEPLVLIHGFGVNWHVWNRLLPELSRHFTIIAPDLRGVGESDKPAGGYDKKNMAKDIHELVGLLGYKTINLVGHDIGLMVAYAYAAQFGDEVKKVVLSESIVPGVEPIWTKVYTTKWWFGFFARPVAGKIVADHVRDFFEDFWTIGMHRKGAFTEDESDEFIRAYSTPGATTGSFQWYGSIPQDVIDNSEFMKRKLQMPVLAMGAEFYLASFLVDDLRAVADNITELKILDSGHFVVQEQTAQVQKGLIDFFMN